MAHKPISVAIYRTHGKPAEVLKIETGAWAVPAAGEVIVQMKAAPINPADLNAIEGKYPGRSEVPAVPGMEGVGIVMEHGPGVTQPAIGSVVILPHHVGTWREALAVKADELVVVPPGIDFAQASMLKINPLTAWRMLRDYVALKPGDWVIQNAANSAAGRCVIQLAHELGWKTVNVVRRPELIEELRAEGADVVLVEGEKLREQVQAETKGAPILLGFNAVGGETALRVMNCLAQGGTMVSYGAMSLQPLRVPTGMLIFRDLRLRGIWINKVYENASLKERMEAFAPIFDMAKRGQLKTKIAKSYPLSDALAAVAHAAQSERGGKIIFEFP